MPQADTVELFRMAALRAPRPPLGAVPRITFDVSAASFSSFSHSPVNPLRGNDDNDGSGSSGNPRPLSLDSLDTHLLRNDDEVPPQQIRDWVRDATRTNLKTLVTSPTFLQLRRSIHTELLSALLPAEGTATAISGVGTAQARQTLLRSMRILSMLEAIAVPGTAPQDAAAVRRHLRYSIPVLPDWFPRPAENLARPPVVADLKVVRLGSPRYEPGAIAHIENVMASERRERTHRLLEQMETTQTQTSERVTETEQELGTASQLDMLQETAQVLRESTDIEAGVGVSASYGPTVTVDADARVARHSSSEETNRLAVSFSNQITKRARERVIERVSETRVVRRLLETEETNVHGFDNTQGREHRTGIYRWVDSVQEAWIENYGKRLMLEFLIHEPAAFLRWAAERAQPRIDVGATPSPPTNPNNAGEGLSPEHINAENYLVLVAQYGASDVQPPPPESLDLSVSYSGTGDSDLYLYEDSTAIKVPAGYRAIDWEAHCITWGSGSPDGEVFMASVGAYGDIRIDSSPSLQKQVAGPLDAGAGSVLPVVMLGRGLINLAASVRVRCTLTSAGRAAWQLSVFDAVMRAHQRQVEDYEVRVARAEAEALGNDEPLVGANPSENQILQRRELRRSVIHHLLGHSPHTGAFGSDAVNPGDTENPPQPDLDVAAAERDPISFFEQAFEWANMTWVHYPYYWADQDKWAEDCRRAGTDPAWTAFLSAGASRVVAPVRPGFEAAVALYLATGIIWSGGQVPTIGDPAYLGIAEEVAASLGTGSTPPERIELDPVRLPTSLVWLQPTADLNSQADGSD